MKKSQSKISREEGNDIKHDMNHILNEGIIKVLLDKYKPSGKLRTVKDINDEFESKIAA